ncbi:MAG: hypothetical protein R2780_09170 [Crocinitomicaceae bacterium]|nr:hypothetical protein [Crocinitomicaceae bacterium]
MKSDHFSSLLNYLLIVAVAVIIIGALFKIMHWPGAGILLIIGYTLIITIYPREMIRKKDRTRLDIFKGLGVLIYGGATILKLFLFQDQRILLSAIGLTGLLVWVAVMFYDYFAKDTNQKSLFSKILNILFVLGGVIAITGMFFRVMHWPGANTLLLCGIVPLAIAMGMYLFAEPDEET